MQRLGRRTFVSAVALLSLSVGLPVAGAQAQPTDTTVLTDDFESGSFAPNWVVTTGGQGVAAIQAGIGTNGSKAARLTVPNYNTSSIANIRHTLGAASYGISASGRFKVNSGGCSDAAGYSAGNVPFVRFFDGDGKRVAGLYRINGSCSKTAKLYVQHSGGFYRTGKNISFGTVYSAELRIAVSTPSKSLVQVYLDGSKVYETLIADNGLKPIASVNVHNEHNDQVGDLVADDIKIATFGAAAPVNPCDGSVLTPNTTDPGTSILADGFESFTFDRWTTVTREGDATASIQTTEVHAGQCAALLNVTAAVDSKANLAKTTPAGTAAVTADGWFKVIAEGTNTNSNVPFFRLFAGGARIVDVYRQNGNGAMFLRLPNGSTFTYTSLGRTLALNTWYQIKVYARAAGAGSTVTVSLNGAQIYTTSTAPLGSSIDTVMLGSEHFAQQGKLAADEVTINAGP